METESKCAAGDRPCATCPWRRQSQTHEAVAASPRDFRGVKWFDVENLRRHWEHIRTGGMMPCHATDERAHLYGGKLVRRNVEARLCVGLVVMARREVHRYLVEGGEIKRYTALGGTRFTLAGLAQWAARLVYQGATFETFTLDDGVRRLTMPTLGDDEQDVRLPWDDVVQSPLAIEKPKAKGRSAKR